MQGWSRHTDWLQVMKDHWAVLQIRMMTIISETVDRNED